MVSCIAIRNERQAWAPETDGCASAQPGSEASPPTKPALTISNRLLITPWVAVEAIPARFTLHPLEIRDKPDRTKIDNLLRSVQPLGDH